MPSSDPRAEEERERVDAAILSLLLCDEDQRPWAVEEIEREIGDPLAVTDSLARLHAVGLVHRLERFAFPSRAAVRGAALHD